MFRFMSHVKIITCLHITQNFHHMVNLNQTFQCACNDTYKSHQLYFCVCINCYKNLVVKKDCDIEMINMKWMKFCMLRTSLDTLTFCGNTQFFSFNDIIKIVPSFWNYRSSLIFEKCFTWKPYHIWLVVKCTNTATQLSIILFTVLSGTVCVTDMKAVWEDLNLLQEMTSVLSLELMHTTLSKN